MEMELESAHVVNIVINGRKST